MPLGILSADRLLSDTHRVWGFKGLIAVPARSAWLPLGVGDGLRRIYGDFVCCSPVCVQGNSRAGSVRPGEGRSNLARWIAMRGASSLQTLVSSLSAPGEVRTGRNGFGALVRRGVAQVWRNFGTPGRLATFCSLRSSSTRTNQRPVLDSLGLASVVGLPNEKRDVALLFRNTSGLGDLSFQVACKGFGSEDRTANVSCKAVSYHQGLCRMVDRGSFNQATLNRSAEERSAVFAKPYGGVQLISPEHGVQEFKQRTQ
jgi:hypothetical protein